MEKYPLPTQNSEEPQKNKKTIDIVLCIYYFITKQTTWHHPNIVKKLSTKGGHITEKEYKMSRKFLVGAILLVAFAQVGYAQSQNPTAVAINRASHTVVINESTIWFINNTNQALSDGGRIIRLYIDETNPTYFALVYNTIKDYMSRGSGGTLGVWTTPTTSQVYGQYAKITQIYYK